MPVEVIMPKVDMDMAAGTLMTWHKAEGDTVTKGEALFDIETDKAAMEVEAEADGILHHLLPEGTSVDIGKPVAWLYRADEEVGAAPNGEGPASSVASGEPTQSEPAKAPVVDAALSAAVDVTQGVRATPRARALAREAAIDLAAVTGSGPRGRVQARDIAERAAPPKTTAIATNAALSITRSGGETGTPVVLLHGFASDATSWARIEKALHPRPIIRVDLPAHGESPLIALQSFEEMVGIVRHAVDDLNLEAFHLIGHSLGGALALALADTRSRSVASLALIAPAGLGPGINAAALNGLCGATRVESLAPWLREMVAPGSDLITDQYARLAMAGREDPDKRKAQARLADALFPDGTQAFDLRPALQRLSVPARLIWGKQDAILPWQHALCAPGTVAIHLFSGVGHMPQIEAPEAVGKLLAALS